MGMARMRDRRCARHALHYGFELIGRGWGCVMGTRSPARHARSSRRHRAQARFMLAVSAILITSAALGSSASTSSLTSSNRRTKSHTFGSSPTSVEHVGIFVGNGLMIDAPYTGAYVRFDRVDGSGLAIVGVSSPGGQQIA
jgi:hypothetical protein